MELNKDTRIIDMTLGQFEDWMKSMGFQPASASQKKNLVYGLAGIMKLFNCSEQTAVRLRNGVIKDAVSQPVKGGKLVIDADKALLLYNAQN